MGDEGASDFTQSQGLARGTRPAQPAPAMKLPTLSLLLLLPTLASASDLDRIGSGIDALNHPGRQPSCGNFVDSIGDALRHQRADEDTVAKAMKVMAAARVARRLLT